MGTGSNLIPNSLSNGTELWNAARVDVQSWVSPSCIRSSSYQWMPNWWLWYGPFKELHVHCPWRSFTHTYKTHSSPPSTTHLHYIPITKTKGFQPGSSSRQWWRYLYSIAHLPDSHMHALHPKHTQKRFLLKDYIGDTKPQAHIPGYTNKPLPGKADILNNLYL